MGSPASHGVPQPREGWQPCHGIGGSFAVESAAAFVWNRWQACYGISGNFRVERVAALPWNQWQNSPGIGGSFAVEYALVAGLKADAPVGGHAKAVKAMSPEALKMRFPGFARAI